MAAPLSRARRSLRLPAVCTLAMWAVESGSVSISSQDAINLLFSPVESCPVVLEGRLMRKVPAMFLVFACSVALVAQTLSPLSPEVRRFVTVDAAVVALTHVRVIDGTGAAARGDPTG